MLFSKADAASKIISPEAWRKYLPLAGIIAFMRRRQALLGIAAAVTGSAGCLVSERDPSSPAGTPTETPSPMQTSTPTETPTPTDSPTATPTESLPDPVELSSEPSYGQSLTIRNRDSKSHTVDVRVTHAETDEQVYADSIDIDPDERIDVFEFSTLEDEYEGVESFEIRAEIDDEVKTSTFRTSKCHASAEIIVDELRFYVTEVVC